MTLEKKAIAKFGLEVPTPQYNNLPPEAPLTLSPEPWGLKFIITMQFQPWTLDRRVLYNIEPHTPNSKLQTPKPKTPKPERQTPNPRHQTTNPKPDPLFQTPNPNP